MAFRGWPAAALEFFVGLEADNSRDYWHAHRSEYDTHVKAPMEELLQELEPDFGSGRIFRPNRDTRFSRDKSPYKTNIAATFERGGYVSLSADGLGVGSGYYMLAPDQLERFRRAVAADRTGGEVEALVRDLRSRKYEVNAHEVLKTAPKGYPKDHPRIDLLRHKGLIVWRHWEPAAWLGTKAAKARVVEVLRAAEPLVEWLDANVGESRLPVHR